MRGVRGRGAAVGLVVLLAALTSCTDRVPAAAPASSAHPVAHSSTAASSTTPRERPAPSGPTPAPGATGQSPSPESLPGAASGAPSATPRPSPSGTDTRTGPIDDGGDDARAFCAPTALSFTFRTADGPRGPGGSRPGADVRAESDAVLVVRNTSGHTCVLHGAPTLTVLDDSGHGAPLVSAPAKPFAKPFALHPGANGVARVHHTPRRGCASHGSAVRVTLPGSDTAITVAVLDAHGRPAALALCGPAPRTGPFRPGFG
ncbi:DUF4232 domain-containing protein [Streptomyces sp. ASQP_92]|uniref:DUF4232 domain-containing protein n=1 Tax=Streptomyces sp. ASQP_92 TaxID=2979116 RepID=UPI0021C0E581|nr:DUF4232 domain-containing protein [Streptomyces sp. ASQP_92]MCT9092690.1 DUF4232 domain-containing protein [Streptomyces sp. ASQP_92]